MAKDRTVPDFFMGLLTNPADITLVTAPPIYIDTKPLTSFSWMEIKGELAKAYIVLKEGTAATEQELIDYVRTNIAKFKAPKMVEFVDSLPQGPTGKILKRELRDKLLKNV